MDGAGAIWPVFGRLERKQILTNSPSPRYWSNRAERPSLWPTSQAFWVLDGTKYDLRSSRADEVGVRPGWLRPFCVQSAGSRAEQGATMKGSLVCKDRRRVKRPPATSTGSTQSLYSTHSSARPDARCASFNCCKGADWSSHPGDGGSHPSSERNSSIIGLLDRDCELRRHYLKQRWQGVSNN